MYVCMCVYIYIYAYIHIYIYIYIYRERDRYTHVLDIYITGECFILTLWVQHLRPRRFAALRPKQRCARKSVHMAHFQFGSFLIGLVSNWAQF